MPPNFGGFSHLPPSQLQNLRAVDEYFTAERKLREELLANQWFRPPARGLLNRRRSRHASGARETPPSLIAAPGPMVECPVCNVPFDWNSATIAFRAKPDPIDDLTVGKWREIVAENQVELMNRVQRQLPQVICGGPGRDRLPLEYNDYPQIRIAIVGAAGSSKSTYLAALVRELLRRVPGLHVEDMNGGNHEALEREKIEPIFSQHKAVLKTQSLGQEGIYAVCYKLSVRSRPGATYTLVFADVAGDDVSDKDRAIGLTYLKICDGVIALVDPSTIPSIVQLAEIEPGNSEWKQAELPIRSFMNNQSIEGGAGRFLGRLYAPMSLVMSKADLVADLPLFRHLGRAFIGSEWLNRPDFARTDPTGVIWDRQVINTESKDVVSCLLFHRQHALLEQISNSFWSSTFHFASATNARSKPVSGGQLEEYVRPPSPRRVVQPLLSILDRLGILDNHQSSGTYLLPLPELQEHSG